jgi:hypothetical protein
MSIGSLLKTPFQQQTSVTSEYIIHCLRSKVDRRGEELINLPPISRCVHVLWDKRDFLDEKSDLFFYPGGAPQIFLGKRFPRLPTISQISISAQ